MDKKTGSAMTLVYIISFVLAACSILYELMIAQTVSLLSINTVIRYSVTIGLYLGAMGIGALLCQRLFGKKERWRSLFFVEILLSLAGGLAVAIVHYAHMIYGYMFLEDKLLLGVGTFFTLSFLVVVGVGFLTGLELPLLIAIANELCKEKKVTNRVLAMDYFGSLAGAFSFPLLLLPNFEVISVGLVVAFLNLAVALFILFSFLKKSAGFPVKAGVGFSLSVLIVVAFFNINGIQQYFLQKYYYYYESFQDFSALFRPCRGLSQVERYSSPYQKIDIVRYKLDKDPFTRILVDSYSTKYIKDPQYPRDYYLFLNGDFQFSTDEEEVYHEYFAHLPIILNGAVPKKILVLGAGDGLLNRELLKYPQVQKIVQVEIDERMIQLAKSHPVLSYLNRGSLEDPKVEVNIADGYHYIKDSQEKFDAIFIDFPDPYDYDMAKLYSREFYQFVRKRLNKGGFAVLDSPGSDVFSPHDYQGEQKVDPQGIWLIYYNTLKAAGFGTIIPFVTNLELDNQQAQESLRKEKIALSGPGGGRYLISKRTKEDFIKQIIRQYVEDMQKGFIFLKPESEELQFRYHDPAVELHVLNEKRFELAFALPYQFPEGIDEDKINSIMRPKFPGLPFWFVLLPY
ncbi:MAG: hypothetical protein JW869_06960 [Candidatus Omnitrophica bacterium]|nr:hypothetical protein [Candidatus Omnitrophota bacterium]